MNFGIRRPGRLTIDRVMQAVAEWQAIKLTRVIVSHPSPPDACIGPSEWSDAIVIGADVWRAIVAEAGITEAIDYATAKIYGLPVEFRPEDWRP